MATDIPMSTLKHVTYKGTELNAFSAGGCEWRKPYTLTIPTKPTGVASITVTRSASESNCGQVTATSLTASGTVLYGDALSVSGTGAAGYNTPTVSFSSGVTSGKVTGNVTVGVTVGSLKTYTITIVGSDYGKVQNGTTVISSGASISHGTQLTLIPSSFTGYTTKVTTSYGGISSTGTTGITVTGDLTITFTKTANTYYVYYKQGTASSTTNLPSTQSRTYPNAVTLATNSMTKSSTTDTYTVTYNYNGSGASNTTATATKTTTYTANGWTTTSGSTTRNYANGASFGSGSTTNLTLYPCFSQSTSTNSVILPTPTRSGYTFMGWATSSSATIARYLGGASYTPTADITLYAIWQKDTIISVLFPSVTSIWTSIGSGSISAGYTYSNSATKTYPGYDDYSICTIDGIEVGTSYRTIKTTYSVNSVVEKAYVTYDAKFINGTLTTRTRSIYWITGDAYMAGVEMNVPAGASYSTSAIFGTECDVTFNLGKYTAYSVEIDDSKANSVYNLAITSSGTTETVNTGTEITLIGWSLDTSLDPTTENWTITGTTTITPPVAFNVAPTYVSASTSTSSITLTFKNPTSYAATLYVTRSNSTTQSASIAANSSTTVSFTGLTSGTTYTFTAYLQASGIAAGPTTTKSVTTSSSSQT